jgi:branched-subunit amino acid transport protein
MIALAILAFVSVMPFLLGYWLMIPKWVQYSGLGIFTAIVVSMLVWAHINGVGK